MVGVLAAQCFDDPNLRGLDQVVLLVPARQVPQAALLAEGRWVLSGKQDWMVRVDPADPATPTQRHVHIARAKHTTAKNQQASWNEDRTRHDRISFNVSVGALSVVQNLAKAALGLPSEVVLEHVSLARQGLAESTVAEQAELAIAYMVLKCCITGRSTRTPYRPDTSDVAREQFSLRY